MCGDADAAEDIAQEAFLSALRSLDRFDLRRPFGPWLHRIVVNRAIDDRCAHATPAGRSRGRGGPGTAQAPPRESLSDATASAIGALPVEQRAVIVMRYLLDYRPGEIARALDVPRGTVNSRIRRGLDALAADLGAEKVPVSAERRLRDFTAPGEAEAQRPRPRRGGRGVRRPRTAAACVAAADDPGRGGARRRSSRWPPRRRARP